MTHTPLEQEYQCGLCLSNVRGHPLSQDPHTLSDIPCEKCIWDDCDFGPGGTSFEFEFEKDPPSLQGIEEYFWTKLNGSHVCHPCYEDFMRTVRHTVIAYARVMAQLKVSHQV